MHLNPIDASAGTPRGIHYRDVIYTQTFPLYLTVIRACRCERFLQFSADGRPTKKDYGQAMKERHKKVQVVGEFFFWAPRFLVGYTSDADIVKRRERRRLDWLENTVLDL